MGNQQSLESESKDQSPLFNASLKSSPRALRSPSQRLSECDSFTPIRSFPRDRIESRRMSLPSSSEWLLPLPTPDALLGGYANYRAPPGPPAFHDSNALLGNSGRKGNITPMQSSSVARQQPTIGINYGWIEKGTGSSVTSDSKNMKFKICRICKMPPIRDSNPVVSCAQCQHSFHSRCHTPAIDLLSINRDAPLWRCNHCTRPLGSVSYSSINGHLHDKTLDTPVLQPILSPFEVESEQPASKRQKISKDVRAGNSVEVPRCASSPRHSMSMPSSVGQLYNTTHRSESGHHYVFGQTQNNQTNGDRAWQSVSLPLGPRHQGNSNEKGHLLTKDGSAIRKTQFLTPFKESIPTVTSTMVTRSAEEHLPNGLTKKSAELADLRATYGDGGLASRIEDSPDTPRRNFIEESAFIPARHIDSFNTDPLNRVVLSSDGGQEENSMNSPNPHRWTFSQLTQTAVDGHSSVSSRELVAKHPLSKDTRKESLNLHITAINASRPIGETRPVHDIDDSLEAESQSNGFSRSDVVASPSSRNMTVDDRSADGNEDMIRRPNALVNHTGTVPESISTPMANKTKFEPVQCSGCKRRLPQVSSRRQDKVQCGVCRNSTFPPRILSLLNPAPSSQAAIVPGVPETPKRNTPEIIYIESDGEKDVNRLNTAKVRSNNSSTSDIQQRSSPLVNDKADSKESHNEPLKDHRDGLGSIKAPQEVRKRKLEETSSDPGLESSPNRLDKSREGEVEESGRVKPLKRTKVLEVNKDGRVPKLDTLGGPLNEKQDENKSVSRHHEEALRTREEELKTAQDKIQDLMAKQREMEKMLREQKKLFTITPQSSEEFQIDQSEVEDVPSASTANMNLDEPNDHPHQPQRIQEDQAIPSTESPSESRLPPGFASFMSDPENLDFREKDFFKAFPEFRHENIWFDKEAKIQEINARPSRKQTFGKRLAFSRSSRRGNVHHELERHSPAHLKKPDPYDVPADTNGQPNSFRAFFGIPDKVIPTMHEKNLAYRDEVLTSSGKLRRAKFMHNVGRNPLA